MAAKWTNDSEAALDTIARAYGSRQPTRQEMASRKATVVKFGKDELDTLEARIEDTKAALSRS